MTSNEEIKVYLEAAPGALGFVSCQALRQELAARLLEPVPIENLTWHFEAVRVQGQPLTRSAQRFLRFTRRAILSA